MNADRLRRRGEHAGGVRQVHEGRGRALDARWSSAAASSRTMSLVFQKKPLTKAIEAIAAAGGSERGRGQAGGREPGDGQPDRPRLARHRHDAALRRGAARGRAARQPEARGQARRRRAARARRPRGLRADRSASQATRMAIARAKQHGICDRRARQLAPPRPHRPLGRDGGRRGPGLDAFRQRAVVRARRAVRRRRPALRHQPGLHRHPAARRAAVPARHGDQRGGAGQAARRAQQGREDPAGLADRRPGQSRPTIRAGACCSPSARC